MAEERFINDQVSFLKMKIMLHHFDQNAHAIVRFNEVKVVSIYDERKKYDQVDSGEFLGRGRNNIILTNNFEKALDEAIKAGAELMVTTGEGLYFTKPEKVKDWEQNVRTALEKGLSVYNMSKILFGEKTKEFQELAKRKGIKFEEASDPDAFEKYKKYLARFEKEGIKTKVISFLGTSMNSGKITSMLTIRRKLKEKGKKPGVLGTEPSSIFLGCDEQVVPEIMPTLRGAQTIGLAIKKIEVEKKPEVILVGGQTGLTASVFDIKEARAGAVVAWQILFGSNPDEIILHTKASNKESVKPHLELVRNALPEVKVRAIIVNGFKSEKEEVQKIVEELEKETGILTLDIFINPDKLERLLKEIINK